MNPKPKKLLEQVSDVPRRKQYAYRNGKTYSNWIKQYIFYHSKRHPREMGEKEILALLSYLSRERKLTAST